MVLQCKLAMCLLDLCIAGVAADAENFIIAGIIDRAVSGHTRHAAKAGHAAKATTAKEHLGCILLLKWKWKERKVKAGEVFVFEKGHIFKRNNTFYRYLFPVSVHQILSTPIPTPRLPNFAQKNDDSWG